MCTELHLNDVLSLCNHIIVCWLNMHSLVICLLVKKMFYQKSLHISEIFSKKKQTNKRIKWVCVHQFASRNVCFFRRFHQCINISMFMMKKIWKMKRKVNRSNKSVAQRRHGKTHTNWRKKRQQQHQHQPYMHWICMNPSYTTAINAHWDACVSMFSSC